MAFDYKKEYKEFYLPPKKPEIIDVPAMNFVAVRGQGNPNVEDGQYQRALNILYGVSFTIKMSYKGSREIEGYFPYVVPPLEGLWWQEGICGVDYGRKNDFQWISMIRLPEFATEEVFQWAVEEASAKKKTDFSKAEFLSFAEGLCVQCMHIGPYDDEPVTIESMDQFALEKGLLLDFSDQRRHHEIYLSDPRRAKPERLRTVIRHPVKEV
ncbi:GyrI-like domain-containing protein [Ihubacter sp. mB4P-1]|uniref:GyrI-like domain-containing protein n=1 Tax=Ihubacter sp. mB4P-1 TaxID=3242370 RepID=UPI00137B64BE